MREDKEPVSHHTPRPEVHRPERDPEHRLTSATTTSPALPYDRLAQRIEEGGAGVLPAAILSLQRIAGNGAVAQLLTAQCQETPTVPHKSDPVDATLEGLGTLFEAAKHLEEWLKTLEPDELSLPDLAGKAVDSLTTFWDIAKLYATCADHAGSKQCDEAAVELFVNSALLLAATTIPGAAYAILAGKLLGKLRSEAPVGKHTTGGWGATGGGAMAGAGSTSGGGSGDTGGGSGIVGGGTTGGWGTTGG